MENNDDKEIQMAVFVIEGKECKIPINLIPKNSLLDLMIKDSLGSRNKKEDKRIFLKEYSYIDFKVIQDYLVKGVIPHHSYNDFFDEFMIFRLTDYKWIIYEEDLMRKNMYNPKKTENFLSNFYNLIKITEDKFKKLGIKKESSLDLLFPETKILKRTWDNVNEYLTPFKFLFEIPNVFIAGGKIFSALFETPLTINNDIDIFIYGCDENEAEKKLKQIILLIQTQYLTGFKYKNLATIPYFKIKKEQDGPEEIKMYNNMFKRKENQKDIKQKILKPTPNLVKNKEKKIKENKVIKDFNNTFILSKNYRDYALADNYKKDKHITHKINQENSESNTHSDSNSHEENSDSNSHEENSDSNSHEEDQVPNIVNNTKNKTSKDRIIFENYSEYNFEDLNNSDSDIDEQVHHQNNSDSNIDELINHQNNSDSDIDELINQENNSNDSDSEKDDFDKVSILRITVFRSKNVVTIKIIRPQNGIDNQVILEFQVILRLYKTVSEILHGFDVDSCCLGFDGNTIWATERCIFSLTKCYNTVNYNRLSPSYESRLVKYAHRGISIYIPGFNRKNVNNEAMYELFDSTHKLETVTIYDDGGNESKPDNKEVETIYYYNRNSEFLALVLNRDRKNKNFVPLHSLDKLLYLEFLTSMYPKRKSIVFESIINNSGDDISDYTTINSNKNKFNVNSIGSIIENILHYIDRFRNNEKIYANLDKIEDLLNTIQKSENKEYYLKFINLSINDFFFSKCIYTLGFSYLINQKFEDKLKYIFDVDPIIMEFLDFIRPCDFPRVLKFKVTNPGEQMTNTFNKIVFNDNSEWWKGKFYKNK